MPYNVNYTDESKRLAKIARSYTQEGKNKSRKIKFTSKSKEALKKAITKRLEKKKNTVEQERSALAEIYETAFAGIGTELEKAAVKGTSSIGDLSFDFDYLRELGVELVRLDRKINSLNNRLVVEGRKTFNLKGITFKKVVSGISRYKEAILARRDEKKAFSEKFNTVKDNVNKFMSEQEYLAANQELSTLSDYSSVIEGISNNSNSGSNSNKETVDSAEVERLLVTQPSPVLSIDEIDEKFVSERKQVSDEISGLRTEMEKSFQGLKSDVSDSLSSISSEAVAAFDEKIRESGIASTGTPVVEKKPTYDFSKFIAKPPVVEDTKKSDGVEDISSEAVAAFDEKIKESGIVSTGTPVVEKKPTFDFSKFIAKPPVVENTKKSDGVEDISSYSTDSTVGVDKIGEITKADSSKVDPVGQLEGTFADAISSLTSEVETSFEAAKNDVNASFESILKKAEEGFGQMTPAPSVVASKEATPIVQASSEEKESVVEAPMVDGRPDYGWLKDTYDVVKQQAKEITERDAEIAYLKGVIAKLRVDPNYSYTEEGTKKI